uniref:Epidermal growth factor-like domain-containing protein n=1 Tax=Aplanochytrium stocchinoi TaxID=215587 RepID=A0A7S3LRE9_9STRA
MSSCLTLWPADACGKHGTCVNATTCVCEEGWAQSKEFSFFVKTDELERSFCNFNQDLVQAIYIIILITSTICLILQVPPSLASKSRLKRSITWNSGIFFAFLYSAYRVGNPTAMYGFDVVFSFLIGNSLLCLANGALIFFSRYVHYLTKSFPWATEYVRQYAQQLQKLLFLVMVLDVFVFQLHWVIALVPKNSTKLILLRCIFGYLLVRYLMIFVFLYVMQLFINDMNRVLKSMNNQQPTGSMISTGTFFIHFANIYNIVIAQSVAVNITEWRHVSI